MTTLAPGMLLVASPELVEPIFKQSVILLLETGEDGALGVVINHPSPITVESALEDWGSLVCEPRNLFVGGPVQPEVAVALAVPTDPDDPVLGYRPVAEGIGAMELDTPVELLADGLARLRIFAGYAGWSPGQLEDELAEEAWFVLPSEPGDVFRVDPSTLWRDVLLRQGGDLAWQVTRPVDPTLN